MAVQGLRDTSGFTVGGDRAQRPENWREGIMLLFPNGKMPLTALTSLMKSESTDDPKYHWFEKTMSDQRLKLAADLPLNTDPFTVTVVTDGGYEVRPGTLLLAEESGEVLMVTSGITITATQFQVTRDWGAALGSKPLIDYDGAAVNPFLKVIGTAVEEGSAAPTSISYDPTEQWNYTQIFRNTLNATRTAINTRLRTGDQIREAKREALQYHGIEMELAFWFGIRFKDTLNGTPRRTTEGFFSWLKRVDSTRLVTATAAGIDMDELEEHLKLAFEYGSSEKMGFCGNRALLTVQQVVRKNSNAPYTLVQGQKEFGMNVSRLICPFGELVLKTHPLFNRMYSNTSTQTFKAVDGWLAVMDMDEVRYRYLRNSDTKFSDNIQAPDRDSKLAGFLTEAGVEFHHGKSHLVIKGLNKAAKDD